MWGAELDEPADQNRLGDVIEGAFDVHEQDSDDLALLPRILGMVHEDCDGVDGSSAIPTTELSCVEPGPGLGSSH
jgi:hypothetical protein